MTVPTLSLCQLNRATLRRQMLLERQTMPVPAAVERLAGLQAQLALPPYVGLWTRLHDFKREALADLIEDREIVKATWVRATLHLCTAGDYVRFRTTLQPVLTQAWSGIAKGRQVSFDLDRLLAAAREYIGQQPRTFAEISEMLTRLYPGQDVGAMRYAVRTHLPLVQVPVPTGWSFPGNPAFTLAEPWIGRPLASEDHLHDLIARYLAAFGPASAVDVQTWSGLAGLKGVVGALKPELHALRDERGREFLDLPDPPQPTGDEPAPVRFLPEFDNLLLAHKDRRRVIADEHRPRVFLPGLRVRATILVDGFVRGAWKIEKAKDAATLVIEPFEPLASEDRAALLEEGERLLRFVEAEAGSLDIRFLDP